MQAANAPTHSQQRRKLRRVVVQDLGRDAVLLTRYGLVLVDADAAVERSADIDFWLAGRG